MKNIKRLLSLIICSSLLLSSCTNSQTSTEVDVPESQSSQIETVNSIEDDNESVANASQDSILDDSEDGMILEEPEIVNPDYEFKGVLPENTYYGLNDADLLEYVEDTVYSDVYAQLGDGYVIEDVSAIYVSNDYLEELAFNSQKNIYFGYTLEEVEEQFQGTKYVFTLGDDGSTVVVPFEGYDDTFNQVVKNVAIGTGVILVCVTVSVVTAGVGMPAVSLIFATSAKTAAEFAISTAVISAATTAAVTGYQTGDWELALKEAALKGSEGFKIGAITGAVAGGGQMAITLGRSTAGGLTMDEVALILKDHSRLPVQFLKQIHSMDEYVEISEAASAAGLTLEDLAEICAITKYPLSVVKYFKKVEEQKIYFEQARLTVQTVGNELALIRPIDVNYIRALPSGEMVTNLEAMERGYAALDPLTDLPYELHHIGQSVDSPLAILTRSEHRLGENYSILHNTNMPAGQGVHANPNYNWDAIQSQFWKDLAKLYKA